MLDSGKAGRGQYFWEKVEKAFIDEDNNILYGDLDYTDSDEVFAAIDHIDCCKKIVPHNRKNWKKFGVVSIQSTKLHTPASLGWAIMTVTSLAFAQVYWLYTTCGKNFRRGPN